MDTSIILKTLSTLDELSTRICAETNLILPKDGIRRTLSMTLLNKLNSMPVSINVQRTLNNLSNCTKNEDYLNKFIFYNGIELLIELLSNDGINSFINDESEQILSELLTNLAVRREALPLNKCNAVVSILSKWENSSNIVINLNVIKYFHNISELQSNSSSKRTIYGPDIFLLDHPKLISSRKDFDVIFINGMLGSVFFTWRQHDDEVESEERGKTQCWPRDWLSQAVPSSRMIGINALLRPFVWNPMSNIDKINRSIEDRAQEIMGRLELANVGQKPIVWISHSAGGILMKHILRLSQDKPLAIATRAILFMSTPHSGAQSMLGLYYFPFKYFLTPEAKHLETNSLKLLDLNSWFKEFVRAHTIDILTLNETEPTKINKFYSTIIVPKCDGEFNDGHEELNVKSNHLNISKPRNQSDQIYLAILDFIKRTMLLPADLSVNPYIYKK